MVDRSLYAEVVALRALLTTWMAMNLATATDKAEKLRLLEGFAQEEVQRLKLQGADKDEALFITEVAASRVSTIISEIDLMTD